MAKLVFTMSETTEKSIDVRCSACQKVIEQDRYSGFENVQQLFNWRMFTHPTAGDRAYLVNRHHYCLKCGAKLEGTE